jgi:hypothetical protein
MLRYREKIGALRARKEMGKILLVSFLYETGYFMQGDKMK